MRLKDEKFYKTVRDQFYSELNIHALSIYLNTHFPIDCIYNAAARVRTDHRKFIIRRF